MKGLARMGRFSGFRLADVPMRDGRPGDLEVRHG
jgi:hypothetical protein